MIKDVLIVPNWSEVNLVILQNLKVVQKLLVLIIGALIAIVAITSVFLFFNKQVMLQD